MDKHLVEQIAKTLQSRHDEATARSVRPWGDVALAERSMWRHMARITLNTIARTHVVAARGNGEHIA